MSLSFDNLGIDKQDATEMRDDADKRNLSRLTPQAIKDRIQSAIRENHSEIHIRLDGYVDPQSPHYQAIKQALLKNPIVDKVFLSFYDQYDEELFGRNGQKSLEGDKNFARIGEQEKGDRMSYYCFNIYINLPSNQNKLAEAAKPKQIEKKPSWFARLTGAKEPPKQLPAPNTDYKDSLMANFNGLATKILTAANQIPEIEIDKKALPNALKSISDVLDMDRSLLNIVPLQRAITHLSSLAELFEKQASLPFRDSDHKSDLEQNYNQTVQILLRKAQESVAPHNENLKIEGDVLLEIGQAELER